MIVHFETNEKTCFHYYYYNQITQNIIIIILVRFIDWLIAREDFLEFWIVNRFLFLLSLFLFFVFFFVSSVIIHINLPHTHSIWCTESEWFLLLKNQKINKNKQTSTFIIFIEEVFILYWSFFSRFICFVFLFYQKNYCFWSINYQPSSLSSTIDCHRRIAIANCAAQINLSFKIHFEKDNLPLWKFWNCKENTIILDILFLFFSFLFFFSICSTKKLW